MVGAQKGMYSMRDKYLGEVVCGRVWWFGKEEQWLSDGKWMNGRKSGTVPVIGGSCWVRTGVVKSEDEVGRQAFANAGSI